MNKRETGSRAEARVASYLEEAGMVILEKNYRNRQGEIDIIGRHEGFLVFVEVKYRSNHVCGYAAEAVDIRKMRQICKVADFYRYRNRLGDRTAVRYDVVAIEKDVIHWYQNAFPHIYIGNYRNKR